MSATPVTSTMCFKAGKYFTTTGYADFMKSLAWKMSSKSTKIKWNVVFTDTIIIRERILTPSEICADIDKLVDACDTMPANLKEMCIVDYMMKQCIHDQQKINSNLTNLLAKH